jgi:hypothetical protein
MTAELLRRVALRVLGLQSGGKPIVLAMGGHDLGDWQVQGMRLELYSDVTLSAVINGVAEHIHHIPVQLS